MTTDQTYPNPEQQPSRVMIVDDRKQVRTQLRLLLELSGNITVVSEAANGPEAIQCAAETHPDVVVMDLEMPGMNGFQACRQIKMRGLAQRVVFLSIYAGADNVQCAILAGADAYLQKGNPIEDLLSAILMGNRIFQIE